METTAPAMETTPSAQLALPGFGHLVRASRPQTCESSATTIPPSSVPNSEGTSASRREILQPSLLSCLPAVHKTPFPDADVSSQAEEPSYTQEQLAKNRDKPKNEEAQQATESATQQRARKVQTRKRRSLPQPRKAKRSRLGPGQTTPAKNRKSNTRKKQNATGKQEAPVPDNHIEESTCLGLTGKQSSDHGINKKETKSKEKVKDSVVPQTKAGFVKESGRPSKQPCSNTTESTLSLLKPNSKQNHEKNSVTPMQASTPRMELTTPAEGAKQMTFCEDDGEQVQVEALAAETGCGASRPKQGSGHKYGLKSAESKQEAADGRDKCDPETKEMTSLEEKYEDLSRKYMSLVRGLVQYSSTQNKPEARDNSGPSKEEPAENPRENLIVDRSLYDKIYLCKIAGMLGALKIEGGPSKYVRARKLEGFENPYKGIVSDGFEFVEDLMKVGDPDENSTSTVSTIFRDLHMRVLTELWERNRDKEGGKVLVTQIFKVMADQLKQWYLKLIESKIQLRWCAVISEELAEPLYEKLKNMDEGLSDELASTLQSVLKEISNQYQEAEKDIAKVSLDMFCNSCEVCICVARSVPDAALSLDEEDAFAIGRQNGVFSHCVARLQAERDLREASHA